jgi:hypothetical protein
MLIPKAADQKITSLASCMTVNEKKEQVVLESPALIPIVSGYRTKRGGGWRGFYRGKNGEPAAGFGEKLASYSGDHVHQMSAGQRCRDGEIVACHSRQGEHAIERATRHYSRAPLTQYS